MGVFWGFIYLLSHSLLHADFIASREVCFVGVFKIMQAVFSLFCGQRLIRGLRLFLLLMLAFAFAFCFCL